MAFMKYSSALVVAPKVSGAGWKKVRTAAVKRGNLVSQAEKIFGKTFSPDKYLLTHCTIVASVDTDDVPNVKLGSVKENNKTINRKYANYYITPETSKYVNNNGDCWDREVLLKSYRTFIGSHNFQEHVQVEDLSKGRIIDAVARDIGDSIYIDILVATDRKHTQLVEDIESGKLATLSMGCTVDSTICSFCGNVAVDETDMCEHIRYAKMNKFFDSSGKQRIIAELCGHPDMGETAGVNFIEASWVAVPAFTGAVMRNILTSDQIPAATKKKAQEILSVPPAEWSNEGMQKAARYGGMFDDDEEEGGDADPSSPVEELENEMVEVVKKRVLQRLKSEFAQKKEVEEDAPKPEDSTAHLNDTVIREARVNAQKFGVLQGIAKTAKTEIDFIDAIALLDSQKGDISINTYRAALRVGSASQYKSFVAFLQKCKQASEEPITPSYIRKMVRLAKLLDFWASQQRG